MPQGAVGPPNKAVTASNLAIVMMQPATVRAASPWTACLSREHRRQDRAASCAARYAPTQTQGWRWGVSDPAPAPQPRPPKSPGGVAHAPFVRVGNVLGRVCEARVQSRSRTHSISGQSAPRIEADAVPDSASLLPLGRTHSPGIHEHCSMLSTLWHWPGYRYTKPALCKRSFVRARTCSLQPDARRSDQEFSGSDGARQGFPPSVGASRP